MTEKTTDNAFMNITENMIEKTMDNTFMKIMDKIKYPKNQEEYSIALAFMGIKKAIAICSECARRRKCVLKETDIQKCNFFKREKEV